MTDSVWKIFELKDHSINECVCNGGDCRTAPATPGLFKKRGGGGGLTNERP